MSVWRENAQHCCHHQIAGGEAVAIEIGFVAQRLGEWTRGRLSYEASRRPGGASFAHS